MAQIKVTGHEGIDSATAEIAIWFRAKHPGFTDQECYNAAMNVRDAIMEGTRALDHQRQLDAVKDGIFPADRPGPASCPHADVTHSTEWCGCTCPGEGIVLGKGVLSGGDRG